MRELSDGTFKFACYWRKDRNASQIRDLICQVATCDYTAKHGKYIHYIVVVFSGHGGYGTIEGNDSTGPEDSKEQVRIQDEIIDALKPHNMKKTSPDMEIIKLFFIDACRGDGEEFTPRPFPAGQVAVYPSGRHLVAFSTYGGHKAFTHGDHREGSLWLPIVAEHLRDGVKKSISEAIDSANALFKDKKQCPHFCSVGSGGTNKILNPKTLNPKPYTLNPKP